MPSRNIDKFNRDGSNPNYTLFSLREESWNALKNFLVKNGQKCYLSANDFEVMSDMDDKEKTSHIVDFIIPDVGNIMSGDFGEILSYFFIYSDK